MTCRKQCHHNLLFLSRKNKNRQAMHDHLLFNIRNELKEEEVVDPKTTLLGAFLQKLKGGGSGLPLLMLHLLEESEWGSPAPVEPKEMMQG